MNKWQFAVQHAAPSVQGITRTLLQNPGFGITLLRARAEYFRNRRLKHSIATPDGFVIETPNELISYWSFFIEREGWAKEWIESLKSEAKPRVLDVGANAGLFSHLVWYMNPRVQLSVFEPLPKMAAKIRDWQAKTQAQLTLHQAAVSDRSGTAQFYISSENDTTASLRDTGEKKTNITVPVITLDSVAPTDPIFLIKIDVEGCEREALAGGAKTVARARFLLMEAHTPEALRIICQQLGDGWRHRRVGASDYLFIRAS